MCLFPNEVVPLVCSHQAKRNAIDQQKVLTKTEKKDVLGIVTKRKAPPSATIRTRTGNYQLHRETQNTFTSALLNCRNKSSISNWDHAAPLKNHDCRHMQTPLHSTPFQTTVTTIRFIPWLLPIRTILLLLACASVASEPRYCCLWG